MPAALDIPLGEDEVAFLCGQEGTLAACRTLGKFFYLENDEEEIILFTEPGDLIVASSFGVGEKVRRGLRCVLFQIRELGAPLIVLPKGHPASPRLKTVVSIGPRTRLSCKIQPGTHPEQDILCGPEEFHGLVIEGHSAGVRVEGFPGDIAVEIL
jgi:hypothetical protein